MENKKEKKQLSDYLNNLKGFFQGIRELSEKDANMWKDVIIFFIIVDLLGVFWYLKLRALGGALLIIAIIFLVLVLSLPESLKNAKKPYPTTELTPQNPNKTLKEEKQPKMPEEKQEVEDTRQPNQFGFDLGLPSADEMDDRLKDALGESIF